MQKDLHSGACRLDLDNRVERLVIETLTPNPNQRATMRKVMSELQLRTEPAG